MVDLVNASIGNSTTPYPTPVQVPDTAPITTPATIPATAIPSDQLVAEKQLMLDLINQERSKAGVPPLKFDEKLQKMAQEKSDDMVEKSYFSHTSPTYGEFSDMTKTFGISYKVAGENIAGSASVERAHAALMNSPGHKRNILNPSYNYIGIGITASQIYGKLFSQDFISL
jgi:uncharacterized YkwD family protein